MYTCLTKNMRPVSHSITSLLYPSYQSAVRLNLNSKDSALEDAKKAIELDPSYSKAYYRKGQVSQHDVTSITSSRLVRRTDVIGQSILFLLLNLTVA